MEKIILDKKQFLAVFNVIEERIIAAELLLKEGLYRDSISRSYYAFFDLVAALLATRGLIAKTHKGALQQFSLHFVKSRLLPKESAKIMSRLMEKRGEADYEWFSPITKEEAKHALEKVKEFRELVKDKIDELNPDINT